MHKIQAAARNKPTIGKAWPVVLSLLPEFDGLRGTAAMRDVHKMALVVLVLCVTAASSMTRASAQQATFTDAERAGLGVCLAKCPDGDKACNNRCISQSQSKGRAWPDDVRVCIRDCRIKASGADGILSCISGCRLDRMIQY
jgi:hypothetical protein